MKEIQLTQGHVALVDDDMFDYLNQWKWYALWAPTTKSFYAVRQESRKSERASQKIRMSRIVANTPDGLICDHKDGNTLNNQLYNLRNVTVSQNAMNRAGADVDNKLGVRGVEEVYKGFRAYISVNCKLKKYPKRATLDEAIRDREKAEREYYGEYSSR